jgi:acyl dehydratase
MTAHSSHDAGLALPSFDSLTVGDRIPDATYRLTRERLVRYAGAAGDFNPIHWNARVATGVGLPDVIAHGMLTMATAVRSVTDWVGDPGAVVEYSVRFTRPVVVPDDGVGASIEVSGVIGALDLQSRTARVDLTVRAAGVTVLGKARAFVRLA